MLLASSPKPALAASIRNLDKATLLRSSRRARPFSSGALRGRRKVLPPQAAGFQAVLSQLPILPQLVLPIAGFVGVAGVTTAIWFASQQQQLEGQPEAAAITAPGMKVPRENAVLVFGSTGKLGRILVQQLLASGRTVVAAARNASRAEDTFSKLGLKTGRQSGGGSLVLEDGVDITNAGSLARKGLWQGVSQIAVAVGPVFGRQPDGKMGYTDNMTSERVDAEGVSSIVAAANENLPSSTGRQSEVVLPMGGTEGWERLDDVIMGGQSSSSLQASDNGGVVWAGQLVLEGGGFCGTRRKGLKLDLSKYDGILLRVKGDGQTYKVNLKTADRGDDPESTYAATFETAAGDWTSIYIPWREFVPVKRAKYDPTAPPLDASKVTQLGFRLSRFDFNSLANPNYHPGPFRLEFEAGISAFKDVRPAVVMVSSAAVERNAEIGDNEEKRKADIPIVQLNPGGILNYKYMGENALRASGLPYAVVRATGLTSENEDTDFMLEASQGDRIFGKITRSEVATVVASALSTPASTGKTVEVRRSEAQDGRGKKSSAADLERLFLAAVTDVRRQQRGLPPLPAPVPPPPAPTEDRVKQILADPAVQAAAQRSRDKDSKAEKAQGTAQEEAREWIRDWRARTLEGQLPAEERQTVTQK